MMNRVNLALAVSITALAFAFAGLFFKMVDHAALTRMQTEAKLATAQLQTVVPGQARKPRNAWPALGEEKTIAIGEVLKGGMTPKAIIFCGVPTCTDLAADIDDAFQIADWPSDIESAAFGTEEDGILIGPPGPAADRLKTALALTYFPLRIVEMKVNGDVGVIIGKKPR